MKKNIRDLIKEVLSTPTKKCSCGCNTCGDKSTQTSPILNKQYKGNISLTENIKFHIINKIAIHDTKLPVGSKAYLDLWKDARFLYSREVIDLFGEDKKIIKETNLGEYKIVEGKIQPLFILKEK